MSRDVLVVITGRLLLGRSQECFYTWLQCIDRPSWEGRDPFKMTLVLRLREAVEMKCTHRDNKEVS